MKLRVAEYNEVIPCLRVAHIDFYLDKDGGYVAVPFTKGEVEFSRMLATECTKADVLQGEVSAMRTAIEDLGGFAVKGFQRSTEALEKIVNWSEAYPLDVFPEPDLTEARRLLEAGGITLDSIAAYAIRYAVQGIGRIASEGLRKVAK